MTDRSCLQPNYRDGRPSPELLREKPDPTHATELARNRDLLNRRIPETDDKGRFPESDRSLRAVLDRWGEKAVNREYDRVREEELPVPVK